MVFGTALPQKRYTKNMADTASTDSAESSIKPIVTMPHHHHYHHRPPCSISTCGDGSSEQQEPSRTIIKDKAARNAGSRVSRSQVASQSAACDSRSFLAGSIFASRRRVLRAQYFNKCLLSYVWSYGMRVNNPA